MTDAEKLAYLRDLRARWDSETDFALDIGKRFKENPACFFILSFVYLVIRRSWEKFKLQPPISHLE